MSCFHLLTVTNQITAWLTHKRNEQVERWGYKRGSVVFSVELVVGPSAAVCVWTGS